MAVHAEDKENRREDVDSWSVSGKQIMTTHVVTESWEAFCRDKKELVNYIHQHYY